MRGKVPEFFLDVASLALGILSVFVWPIWYLGFAMSAGGAALGIAVLWRRRSAVAAAGIVLAGVGLALVITDLTIGLLDLVLRTYFQY
jgi:hypothetical protein